MELEGGAERGEMSRRETERPVEECWMSLIRLGKISQLYDLWGKTLISSLPSFLVRYSDILYCERMVATGILAAKKNDIRFVF